jgi:hypothetical protein
MAETLRYFMMPEDELQFLRFLDSHALVLYPEFSESGYVPPKVGPALIPALNAAAYYFAMSRGGEVVGDLVKRGPNKGLLMIDEVASPVFHYERSLLNDDQELVGGRIWAELDVTRDPNDRQGKPRMLRAMFDQMHRHFRKVFLRSEPKGYWVGPRAAAAHKAGLTLREPGHKGRTYGVWG